nr:RecName: Full=Thylakoid lumenal 25.3 kDa protein; AltName: Full=P25.3 [Spinacia oleracea]
AIANAPLLDTTITDRVFFD